MHRFHAIRALIGGWSLWFTATVVQPPHARVCPIHVGISAHAGHAHAAGHAMHSADEQAPGHDNAACDCPDECRCGAPTLATVARQIALRVPATVACGSPAASTPLAVARQRAHVLPFANAPPVPTVAPLA